jgi:hypothetical protein
MEQPMPNPTVPAAGGAMPGRLSTFIADPFVRRAFEHAEREDGTAQALVTVEPGKPRKPLQGGAEAPSRLRELSHAQ